jgi:hypothetical protein
MNKDKLIGNVEQIKQNSEELLEDLKCLTDLYDRPNPYKNIYDHLKDAMDQLLPQLHKMEQFLKDNENK